MNAALLEPTLPSSWYRSNEVYRAEKERIFCREWIAVCREAEVPSPGDSLVLDVLGESILLVRNREGVLRAFHNVCRHRGSRLCRTPAETAELRVALPGGITGGRLIVSVDHPFAVNLMHREVGRKPDYFATYNHTAEWTMGGQTAVMSFWHRPLHAMTDAFTAAGFRITVISEPPPALGARELFPDVLADKPAFLCFIFFVLQAG